MWRWTLVIEQALYQSERLQESERPHGGAVTWRAWEVTDW